MRGKNFLFSGLFLGLSVLSFITLESRGYSSDIGDYPIRGRNGTNPNYQDVENFLGRLKEQGDLRLDRLAHQINAIGRLSNSCTGWLLTPRILVTNQHCMVDDYRNVLPNEAINTAAFSSRACDSLSVEFNAQKHVLPEEEFPYLERGALVYRCRRVLIANSALDFALIELDRPVSSAITPLRIAADFKPISQPVLVIGHPSGRPKQISHVVKDWNREDLCRATPLQFPPDGRGPSEDRHPHHRLKNTHSFEHTCSTQGGSSGSPVLDAENLEVVGIHWGGYTSGGDLYCTWGHFDPSPQAKYDSMQGQNYHPGNSAVFATQIRDFLIRLSPRDLHPTPAKDDVGPSLEDVWREIQFWLVPVPASRDSLQLT